MTWITAHEAVELTGVRMQTLYAYVSRGKIRSRQDGADSRRSLYHRDDVARMAGRQRGQRNAATVGGAMEWGDPVMPSAISTVRDGRLWYRGADAVELARASQLEDVAAVLWGERRCKRGSCRRAGGGAASWRSRGHTAGHRGDGGTLCRRPAHAGPVPGALRAEARGVLATLVVSMFGSQALLAGGSISQQLAAAWKRPRGTRHPAGAVSAGGPRAQCSTFATRVTISTGASLSAGILSGLATLTGPLHGRAAMSLKPLIDAMAHADAEALVRERLHTGLGFPAFGHPLYPPEIRAPPRCWKAWPCQACMPIWPCRSSAWRGAAEHRFRTGGAERRAPSALACPLALFAIGRCVAGSPMRWSRPGQGG